MKKLLNLAMGFLMTFNIYGCATTALSEKLTEQVNAPYDISINGVKSALKNMNLPLVREVKSNDADQIRSNYSDGRKIWIDVHPVTQKTSKIEIRVGTFGDKAVSEVLIKKIISYL